MNQTKTKKALVMSVLSMVLCIAMLVGMTFAWFTDTASTNVNKIQAGKLDVALEMWDATAETKNDDGTTTKGAWVSAEGKTLNFVAKDGRSEILWEPGCTYELPKVRVVNNGNLALKYKVVISGVVGDSNLAEVLELKMNGEFIKDTEENKVTLNDAFTSTDPDGFAHGNLAAGKDSGAISIALHMQETAGNKYQGESISGIAITVLATQDTVEYDSEGNQYDADAEYPTVVTTSEDFMTAINGDENFLVANLITLEDDNVTIDLNGKTIAVAQNCGITAYGNNVTIKNGTFKKAQGTEYSYGLFIKGANTTIEDVTIDSGINVSGYANNTDNTLKPGVSAEIKNCNITVDSSYGYYTVCVQGNASATVTDSTVTKNNSGKANYYFWVEKEYTENGDTIGNSSLTLKNVSKKSNCNAGDYNPGGVEPSVQ